MVRAGTRQSWFTGFLLGFPGGFLLLVLPPLGLILVAVALVLVWRYGRAAPGAGGLLVGAGVLGVVLLGRTKLACLAEIAGGGVCISPTIDAYLGVAAGILGLGLVLTALAIRRARPGS